MPDFLSEPQRWVIPAVLVVAILGTALNLWWERRRPTSYTRRPGVLKDWHALTAEEQEDVDNAALDLGEQAEIDARQNAAEAAEFLAQRVQINALYRP